MSLQYPGLLFCTGKMRLLIFLLCLPPFWQAWGTPAFLETVVPQETLCAMSLSAKDQRLQVPGDTRQKLELTVFLVRLTGLPGGPHFSTGPSCSQGLIRKPHRTLSQQPSLLF